MTVSNTSDMRVPSRSMLSPQRIASSEYERVWFCWSPLLLRALRLYTVISLLANIQTETRTGGEQTPSYAEK